MSRFSDTDGPQDQEEQWAYIRHRGAVTSAMRGKPGQAQLTNLFLALEMLPEPRLIEGALCDGAGVCAMGALIYKNLRNGGMTARAAWYELRHQSRKASRDENYAVLTIGDYAAEQGLMSRALANEVQWENDENYGDSYYDPRSRDMTPKERERARTLRRELDAIRRFEGVRNWALDHIKDVAAITKEVRK